MALQVAWRGRLADPERIDEFENALAELSIARRGYFSPPHGEGRRRGAWLLLEPGLAGIPLLVAPDGTLAGEKDSAEGWVGCETLWGSAEAHALLIEALDALREEFAPGLEVRDGGGYWPGREVEELLKARRAAGAEAKSFDAAALRKAVRAALLHSSEHPRVRISESPDGDDLREGTEAEWDAFDRENKRRVMGVGRAIESRRLMGDLSAEEVVDAMRSEGIGIARQFELEGEEPPRDVDMDDVEEDEAWLPQTQEEPEEDPLLERSRNLILRGMDWADGGSSRSQDPTGSLSQGLMELGGGLAQALSDPEDLPFGLGVVQLKRARRGLEFAAAAVPACRAAVPKSAEALDGIEAEIRAFTLEVDRRLADMRRRWKLRD